MAVINTIILALLIYIAVKQYYLGHSIAKLAQGTAKGFEYLNDIIDSPPKK